MPKVAVKFHNVDFWANALKRGSKFKSALLRNAKHATMLNAKRASALQRHLIQTGGLDKNAALTVAIKGDNKPLVGDSSLFNAITEKPVSRGDSVSVFSGVLRTNEAYNVGVAVHDGIVLKVTSKMRGMFFTLFVASRKRREGKSVPKLQGRAEELFESNQTWYPLKSSTKSIIIPARRWVEMAFSDPSLKKECARRWYDAITHTFHELASGA